MVYLASRRLLKALRALQKWVHAVTKGRASPTKRGHDSEVASRARRARRASKETELELAFPLSCTLIYARGPLWLSNPM